MQNDILIISKLHLSVTEYRYSVSVAMIGGKKSWNSLNEIIHNFYFMRCSIVDFFFFSLEMSKCRLEPHWQQQIQTNWKENYLMRIA